MTIGGNDNGVFSQLVTQCVSLATTDPTGSPCRDTLEADPETSLLLRLEDSAMNVERSLARITELAPEALVVVVGYPAFLPPSGTCHERFPLATGDYDYAREINASFAFEPIVFTSRFISCARKSSVRPTGSLVLRQSLNC